MRASGVYLLLALVVSWYKTFPQEYPFIKYTPKDGLANSRIRNILQDSKGRMFFMTANGLSIYDGVRFTNYTTENGLPNPIVNDMLELGMDSFLLATNTESLNMWVRGKICNVSVANGHVPLINVFFRASDGIIYVASDEGFFRFVNNQFEKIPVRDSANNELPMGFDHVEEIGDYFLLKSYHARVNFNGLFWLHKKTWKVKASIPRAVIHSVSQIPEYGLMLIHTADGTRSLDLQAAKAGVLKEEQLPTKWHFLFRRSVSKIYVDRKKNMWGLRPNSIFRYAPNGDVLELNKTNGLDVKNISGIYIDHENVLWIITDGSGIIKLANKNVDISTSLFGNSATGISALYPHPTKDTVWAFNFTDNILYRRSGQKLEKWMPDSPMVINYIQQFRDQLYLSSDNTIYLGITAKKTQRLELKKIFTDTSKRISLRRGIVDEQNFMYGGGMFAWMMTPDRYVFKTAVPSYSDQVAIDRHNQLWCADRGGNLFRYSINRTDRSNMLRLCHNYKNAIPSMSPRSLVVDREGKVWVGTRFQGLFCFEFRDTTLMTQHHFTTKEGLTDNFIYHLACDSNNIIWAGTQSGVDKISFRNGGYVIEGSTRTNNIFQMAETVAIGLDNQVWALGNGSVIRIKSEEDEIIDYKPKLQVVQLRIGDSILMSPSNEFELPYDNNSLTFEVAAPSFIDEKQVRFSYLLEGSNHNKWSTPSNQASFNFIDLPRGQYTLRVKAFFPVPAYAPAELSYRFTILPPWWQTWWFRVLAAFTITSLMTGMVRFYYHRKLEKQKNAFEKQRAIEQERTRIAMEMHDDLGSGLTTIRYLAGGLGSSAATTEKAAKIANSAKELVDTMNDIIWTMKSDNNTLEEVLGYIRKQTAEQLETAAVDYRFDFPKNLPFIKLSNEKKRNLLLISKEAVHNILKHANATQVELTAHLDKNTLELRVRDNGKGMHFPGGEQFGNGLRNMRKRAQEMGGQLEIENGQGVMVTLTTNVG